MAMLTDTPYITIAENIHAKTSNLDNLVQKRLNQNFPQPKISPVKEYTTIPFPTFITPIFEISIWAQYQKQINQILEKIFYNYDFKAVGSFAIYTEYNAKTKKGEGNRFVAFREGDFTPDNNLGDFTGEERIIKYTGKVKVPSYLILDPNDETLAYGRNRDESKTDNNSKVVYKNQNVVDIKFQVAVQINQNLQQTYNEGDILVPPKK
jgi:hypothetical protein